MEWDSDRQANAFYNFVLNISFETFEFKLELFSDSTYILGAQKNRLMETFLLSTHNMYRLRNKKIFNALDFIMRRLIG